MAILAQPAAITKPATTTPAVLFSSIGSKDKAASAVRRAMFKAGYNSTISDEAMAIIRRDGDLTECLSTGRIEPDDAEELTRVLEESFAPVPFDDPAWDADDDRWEIDADLPPTPAELAVALTKPKDIPTPEDSTAFAALDARYDIRGRLSDEDWEQYCLWAEWHDATYPEPPSYEAAELAEVGILV